MLNNHKPIQFPANTRPQLVVVIDTEEEFDWSANPDPKANTVETIEEIYQVQDIFNEYGIQPSYMVDYPVAENEKSVNILKAYLDAGQCEIGAHLHPWVCPPIVEELSRANMFPGNLSYELEYIKLSNLTDKIRQSFGITPVSYKAGRYGVGSNTAKILEELGYEIDLSICGSFNHGADGGPDLTDYGAEPYWFGSGNSMLEIPLTVAFVGIAGHFSKHIFNLSGHFEFLKARGILSRLGIVDRLMLSPEGYSTEEHKKLTRALFDRGVRTFTWNFHSPTVVPGCTSYVQSKRDVQTFLDSFRFYFDFFLEEMQGQFTTPLQLRKSLETLN